MGRHLQGDGAIEQYIEHLITTGKWHVGLVVGQIKANRDYVVRLIRCPDPAEDTASVEDSDGDEEIPEKPKQDSPIRPRSLELVDEQWVSTHAQQVNRMLPGGLSVIGIFALASPKMIESSQVKLRQLLSSVHNTLCKQSVCLTEEKASECLILQICSISRKLTCRTYDLTDMTSFGKPADWQYVKNLLNRWSTLNTIVSVDIPITVSQNTLSKSMNKQIQIGILPYCKAVQEAMGLVNGLFRDGDEVLVQLNPKSKAPAKQHFAIDILLRKSESSVTNKEVATPVKVILKIHGKMVGRAFVSNRATVNDAIQAVKTDIIRTLVSRCELLCEDLEVVEVIAEKEVYQTPVRVFTRVPGVPIDFCDYKFEDEKIHEVTDRIQELLDIDVDENNLDVHCERHADNVDWSQDSSESLSTIIDDKSESPKSNVTFIGLAIGGVTAALAAVTYMILGDS